MYLAAGYMVQVSIANLFSLRDLCYCCQKYFKHVTGTFPTQQITV